MEGLPGRKIGTLSQFFGPRGMASSPKGELRRCAGQGGGAARHMLSRA